MRKLQANTIYLAYCLFTSLFFWMTFTADSVYYVRVVQMTALQLVLTGTTLEAAVFLLEVPTGIVADLYSRRLSVITGIFLIGAGFLLQALVPDFRAILLAQLLWGAGWTFTSGALAAWLSDEIGEEKANRSFLKGAQFEQIGAVLGALSAMLLGSLRVTLPMVISGALFIVFGVVLMLAMPESQFQPVKPGARHTWKAMLSTFRGGLAAVSHRPVLKTILWIGVLFGFYSEAFDRLWVAHLMNDIGLPADLSPVAWIGAINISGMLLTAAALGILRRQVDTSRGKSIAGAMLQLTSILVGCLVFFAFAPGLGWSILALWLIRITRELNNTLYITWVNQRLEAKVRATVLSMSSQVDAIGQIAGGPLLGVVGSTLSIRAALLASGFSLSPVLVLMGRGLKQENRDQWSQGSIDSDLV
jgi:DHA3 family tetracycline resistance protein-like MFS transporter